MDDTSSLQCLVCTASINSTCYEVDSCRACASFFKRARVNGYNYTCRQGDKKCSTSKAEKFTCRGCRFEKCIAIGMAWDGPMRIRKKKEPILKRIKWELRALTNRRREQEMKIIQQNGGHKRQEHPTDELYDFRHETCMDLYRIFIMESFEFFNNVFPSFSKLAKKERDLIFKDYIVKMSMVENHQRAVRLWGGSTKYQTFSVMTCFDPYRKPSEEESKIDNIDGIVTYAKMNVEDQNSLFLPIFMRSAFTEREYYALMALSIYEIDIECDLSEEAELILENYRREALEDLKMYYENDLGLKDYSTRLGNLMTANHAIQECKAQLKIFFRFYFTMFDVFQAENLIKNVYL